MIYQSRIYQRARLVLIIKVKTIASALPPPVSPCLILPPTLPLPPQLPCPLLLHPTNLPVVQNCRHEKKKTEKSFCLCFVLIFFFYFRLSLVNLYSSRKFNDSKIVL